MDTEAKRAFARIRLEAANEDLTTVRQNLKESRLRAAVNRAYYAVFHVATAALAWQDVQRARHAGVEGAFSEYFIKTKLIEAEFGKIYNKAREVREDADYHPELKNLSAADADKAVSNAERFVQRIERYLNEVGAI